MPSEVSAQTPTGLSPGTALPSGTRLAPPLPGVPLGVVDRPVLRKRLDAGLEMPNREATIVTVFGPAGSGKTTFLKSWMRWRWSLDGVAGGWLELTESHNDVVQLTRDLREVLPPGTPVTGGAPSEGSRKLVVLDRLDALTSTASLALIDGVVRRPAPGLHLVLAGRRHRLSALSSAMLSGALVEIGPADLDLSPTEARRMLLRSGHVMSPDEEGAILARAAGWAAGLRFEMRRRLQAGYRADGAAVVDPMLMEYVTREVLAGLPSDALDLLLRVSAFDTVTDSLARDVTGRRDARSVLDSIERSNRLVRRIPGGVGHDEARFRCHPMLLACLRDQVRRTTPTGLAVQAAPGGSAGGDRRPATATATAGTHELRAAMAWHCFGILDLDRAADEASTLAREVRRGDAPAGVALAALCLAPLVRLRAADDRDGIPTTGGDEEPAGTLSDTWRAHARSSDAGLLAVVAPAVQRAALDHGLPTLADEVLRTVRHRLPGTDEVSVMEAADHAAHRRPAEAARWLAAVDLMSPAGTDPLTTVRGRVLKSVLAARDGDMAAAHTAMARALAMADRTRILLPFLDHRREVSAILADCLGRFGRLNPLAEQVRSIVAPPGRDEELTEREAQVLTELASLRTVPEMAEALGVSENTVKTHLRNVYRKLGTSTRRQTLMAARRGGLL